MYGGLDHFIPARNNAFKRQLASLVTSIQGNDTLKGELSVLIEEHNKVSNDYADRLEKILSDNAKRNEKQDRELDELRNVYIAQADELRALKKEIQELSARIEPSSAKEEVVSILGKVTDLLETKKSKQSVTQMIESSKESSRDVKDSKKPVKKKIVS